MTARRKTTKIKQSPKMPAETRRQQLLDSAEALFRRQGFRSTTTADIARQAGLTKGALYFHFKSKREIAFELIKRAADTAIDDLETNLHPGMKVGDLLKVLARAEAGGHLDYYRQSLDFRHQARTMPEILRFAEQTHNRAIDIVARALGPNCGRTTKQRRQTAVVILCFYEGLMHMKRVNSDAVDIPTQMKLFASRFDTDEKSDSK